MKGKEDLRKIAQTAISECKPIFQEVDAIDEEIRSCDGIPNVETLLRRARKAAGAGDYINKRYKKFEAMVKNIKANKYLQIKISTPI